MDNDIDGESDDDAVVPERRRRGPIARLGVAGPLIVVAFIIPKSSTTL